MATEEKTKNGVLTKEKPLDDKSVVKAEKTVKTRAKEAVKGIKIHIQPKVRQSIEKAVDSDYPVLLIGDTGVGKTTIIRELAKKNKKQLIRFNLTGKTGVDDFIGKWLVRANGDGSSETYWIDGALITAMKKGQWIVLDEINMALPEILSKLHSLLDDDKHVMINEKDSEVIKPHKNFRLFATMNPEDEYAGTRELNKAFLSRFPIVLDIPYSEKEAEIISEQSGVLEQLANKLTRIGREIRSSKEKGLLSYICSTRDLIYCANLIKKGLPEKVAFEVALINKAPNEEKEPISKIIQLITGTEIKIGGKIFKSLDDIGKEIQDKDDIITRQKNEINNVKSEYSNVNNDLNKAKVEIAELKTKTKNVLEEYEKEKNHIKEKAKKLVEAYQSMGLDVGKIINE